MLTGNTRIDGDDCALCAVYPRAYGEYYLTTINFIISHGLSPCLRGIHHDVTQVAQPVRFIPVLTGNTKPSFVMAPRFAVYPRAYGEYAAKAAKVTARYGLSPCLRGILLNYIIDS